MMSSTLHVLKLIASFFLFYYISIYFIDFCITDQFYKIGAEERSHIVLNKNETYVSIKESLALLIAIILSIEVCQVQNKMRAFFWYVGVIVFLIVIMDLSIRLNNLEYAIQPLELIYLLVVFIISWYYFYKDNKSKNAAVSN
jgi:hypothetical protein